MFATFSHLKKHFHISKRDNNMNENFLNSYLLILKCLYLLTIGDDII